MYLCAHACAEACCGCWYLFEKTRWRETLALLLPVFGGVWVCESVVVCTWTWQCFFVCLWLFHVQWRSERERVWEEKMADDQLCGQGWFTVYSKCVWFRRGLLWLVWHIYIWTGWWKRCLWAILTFLSIDWLLFDLEESCGAQEDY